MTPTVGEMNREIREELRGETLTFGGPAIGFTGPSTESIVALEQEVLDRTRKLRGYEAAAALHARVDRSTQWHNSPICQCCTDLAVLAAGHEDWPLVVEWPCDTAKALGLA